MVYYGVFCSKWCFTNVSLKWDIDRGTDIDVYMDLASNMASVGSRKIRNYMYTRGPLDNVGNGRLHVSHGGLYISRGQNSLQGDYVGLHGILIKLSRWLFLTSDGPSCGCL